MAQDDRALHIRCLLDIDTRQHAHGPILNQTPQIWKKTSDLGYSYQSKLAEPSLYSYYVTPGSNFLSGLNVTYTSTNTIINYDLDLDEL